MLISNKQRPGKEICKKCIIVLTALLLGFCVACGEDSVSDSSDSSNDSSSSTSSSDSSNDSSSSTSSSDSSNDSSSPAGSCTAYTESRTSLYGTLAAEEAKYSTIDSAGNVYVSMFYNNGLGTFETRILKYDVSGSKVGETAFSNTSAEPIFIGPDDTIYLANDNVLSVYDTGLNQTGTITLNMTVGSYSGGVADMIITDSHFYVAGSVYGGAAGYGTTLEETDFADIVIGKYSIADGSRVWQTNMDASDSDSMVDTARGIVMADDHIYVTGYSDGDLAGNTGSGDSDIFISKLDTSGNGIWTILHGGSYGDKGRSIAADSSGNIYVTGSSASDLGGASNSGSSTKDIFVSKFNSASAHQWTTLISGGDGDQEYEKGNDILITPGGFPLVCGEIGDGNDTGLQTIDAYAGLLDPDSGDVLWSAMYGDPSLGADTLPARDEAEALCLDASGNIYVVGSTASTTFNGEDKVGSTGNFDVFLLKLTCE